MSKRQLTDFLNHLTKAELKEQLLDLYGRYRNVKEFYDFSFNPDEDKRLQVARHKIAKEYFPEHGKKVKKRRSVAQKIINQLITLEANPEVIIDLMLYNIEVAQTYTSENKIGQEAFYKSMLRSFVEMLEFICKHYLPENGKERIDRIIETVYQQEWINKLAFSEAMRELLVKK